MAQIFVLETFAMIARTLTAATEHVSHRLRSPEAGKDASCRLLTLKYVRLSAEPDLRAQRVSERFCTATSGQRSGARCGEQKRVQSRSWNVCQATETSGSDLSLGRPNVEGWRGTK